MRNRVLTLLVALVLAAVAMAQGHSYRYWIDNDLTSTSSGTVTGETTLQVDIASLPPGMHAIHFEAWNSSGRSSVRTRYFLKELPQTQQATTARYWIDNDMTTLHNNVATSGIIEIDVSKINVGMHAIHYQTFAADGMASAVRTRYFLKELPQTQQASTARYWIDNDTANIHNDVAASGVIEIDASRLGMGIHAIHYQTFAANGMASAVRTRYFFVNQLQPCLLTALISIDGGEAVSYSLCDELIEIDTEGLAEGNHTLTVTLLDEKGGLIGTEEQTFTVDSNSLALESLTIEGSLITNEQHTVVGSVKNLGSNFKGGISLYYSIGDQGNAVLNNTIRTEIASGSTYNGLRYEFTPKQSGVYHLWLAHEDAPNDTIGHSILATVKDASDHLSGDVNADGSVDIGDIVMVISVMTGTETDAAIVGRADVNGDGAVDIGDIVNIISIMTNQPAGARAYAEEFISQQENGDRVSMELQGNDIALSLNNSQEYTAFQMILSLPEGTTVDDVSISSERSAGHIAAVEHTGDGQYLVMGYSLSNKPLKGYDGTLLTVSTKGMQPDHAIVGNVVFANNKGQTFHFTGGVTTGVVQIENDQWTIDNPVYDLQGRKVTIGNKGIYLIGNKKVVVK